MMDRLQSSVRDFERRLSETIAWCGGASLEIDYEAGARAQERLRLRAKAGLLSFEASRRSAYNPTRFLLRKKAKRTLKHAGIDDAPLPISKPLRSPNLQPEWPSGSDAQRFPSNREEQISIVEGVVARRAQLLRSAGRYPVELSADLRGGRLLCYAPDENLFDGAAEYSSIGFFDVENIPPWDTWICYYDIYVIGWVPPELLRLADEGINVNPEGCIFWAPQS